MKYFLFFIITLLFSCQGLGAEQSKLLKLRKTDEKNSVQIYFTFDKLPEFSTKTKGKRVDVILKGLVNIDESFTFPTDDKIIKFLHIARENKTLFSFFLRFTPQKSDLYSPTSDGLVLDILLGNPFTKSYPDLSSKLEGITVVTPETKDYANPYIASPYSNNWRSFIESYESPLKTVAPIAFTLPQFPIISLLPPDLAENKKLLPENIYQLAEQNLWEDMQLMLLDLINSEQDVESKKKLVLTLGETLLRAGNFESAFKQLYLLDEKYSEELISIYSKFLLTHLRAVHENPYIADFEFRSIENDIDQDIPLSPYFHIAQIETALATKQYERMNSLLLQDNVAYPGETQEMRDLRMADYWYATGNFIKAYVGYYILEKSNIIKTHPYSLNGYCDTLYQQKQYPKAATCYQYLGGIIDDEEKLGMISFRRAMAELHSREPADMYTIFSTIENTFPGTEAGLRAALKKTDIQFLTRPNYGEKSRRYYRALAENSITRAIVEEASLKEIIVLRLMDKIPESIDLLLDFIRDFRTGNLKDTAQALLIEILPQEIKRLVEGEEYLKALVLAKRNRHFFAKNWIDIKLLSEIGQAYHQLSIYDEAKKLYLYLLESEGDEDKEHFYLPLIKILFSRGEYDLVEDYATQYFYKFPQGNFKDEVFLLRLKGLAASDKTDQALALMEPELPVYRPLRIFAADTYYLEQDYKKVIETLKPYTARELELEQITLFTLAESNFELEKFEEAEELYLKINEENQFYDQALFRRAHIERENGQEENALKLYRKIVETGKSPLWKKLAEQELDFNEKLNRF